MRGNLFLICVALGIGFGAVAYGFGGVYLLVCGISFISLAWGAAVSISGRDRDAPQFRPPGREPSRLI